jgi:hypothetical protein
MPTSFLLLVAFISDHKGLISGKTIKAWLSGLKAWHNLNHTPWSGDDWWVQMARTATLKEGTAFCKAPHTPITTDHLHSLYKSLNASSPCDAAIWACAMAAFWGCCQLGKLLVTNTVSFDPAFHVCHLVAISFKTNRNNCSSASLHLPWTKTTKQEGSTLVLTAHHDILCPVSALRNHFLVNSAVPPDAPLFAFCSPVSWHHLQKHSFLNRCNKIWFLTSLSSASGHSFHIGGASKLLLAGTPPPEVVAAAHEGPADKLLFF